MGKKSEKKINKKTTEVKNEGRKIITDPRFQSLHSDPRFQNVPKHQSKISIDSRFNHMFTDKNFASSKAQIDKRGKHKGKNSVNPLRHYYKHDDEEIADKSKKKRKEIERESDDDGNHEELVDVNPEELDAEVFRIAKEENFSIDEVNEKVESDDDDVEESESSDDEAILFTDDESEEEEEVENVPEIEKETRRLAVVNMDWSQIRAVDLYVVLTSFLPRGGQIISVSVYPSKFGIERMEEEAVKGPAGLFDSDNAKQKEDNDEDSDDDNTEKNEDSDEDSTEQNIDSDEDSDDDNTEQEGDSDDDNTEQKEDSDHDSSADEGNDETDIPKTLREYQKMRDNSDDENIEEIDISKLRAYEKSRLRYYFAVVEFDSVGTADHIYRNCDGIEFERSSNVLDLRFIPDTVKFDDPPRDVATERPTNYEAPNFQTDALQNCKLRLTWDEDDPTRKKTLRRKLNDDQLAELELNEYLASDISDDDDDVGYGEDEEEQIEKMVKKLAGQRTLLQAGDDSDAKDSENDKDMEITFNTGLEDISKRFLEKKNNKESETVWEALLRRQKEKKKSRKNKSDDDSSESDQEKAHEEPDDFFLEDPSSKKSGKSKKKKSKGKEEEDLEKDQEASRAELELLLADDQGDENNNNVKGYNLKRKKSKGKKGKEVAVEDKIPAAEYDDPRFKSLFTSPLYALDPTDAQYKRSAAYARQIAQKQHGNVGEETEENPLPKDTALPQEETVSKKIEESKPSKVENPELSSMIRSIKRKAQQYQETSTSNASKKQSNGKLLEKVSSQISSGKKKKAKISKN
ncbi:hypothetical protein ACHQM5_021627 [Ranunculus cassubicifolius]